MTTHAMPAADRDADISVTTDIAADPDTVWSVLADVERWPEWTDSIHRVVRTDGTGPLAEGSTARIKQPRLPASRWVVTHLEEGRGFTWESTSSGVRTVAGHWIEPTSSGSRVTLTLRQEGFLAPVVRTAFRSLMRRYVEMEAAGLRERAEARAAAS